MPGKRVLSPEEAKIKRAYLKGYSLRDLERRFGRNRATIGRLAIEGGWEEEKKAIRQRYLEEASTSAEEEIARDLERIRKREDDIRSAIDSKDLGMGDLKVLLDEERNLRRDRHRILGIDKRDENGGIHIDNIYVAAQQLVDKSPPEQIDVMFHELLKDAELLEELKKRGMVIDATIEETPEAEGGPETEDVPEM